MERAGVMTPVKDGSTRGMIAAAITALLAFTANKVEVLTMDDVGTLAPVVVFAGFFLGGCYDRWVRPRIHRD